MRQLFWCSLQIVAFGGTLWVLNHEVKGDFGPYGAGFVALMVTMAVTAAVMIGRDLFLFAVRRIAALRKPNEPDYGADRINSAPRLSQPRELPPGRWIGKEPR